MDVLLCGEMDADEWRDWQAALSAAMPEARWWTPEQAHGRPADISAAVVANPPAGSLQGWPGLRLIQSLWAGVDRLLADPTVPVDVPVARMVDPAMNAAMSETALWATLLLQRDFARYAVQQRRGVWQQHVQRRADECPVLVLGQGEMGRTAARLLAACGYPVTGWSRTPGPADAGIQRIAGDAALWQALPKAQVLVNLLPLTAQTTGLLDARLFAALPRGAGVVNLARGRHLVEADLLAALASGHIAHAVLDVFQVEPLPASHAYWDHPQVTVLPHVAAQTDCRSAAAVAVANLRAMRDGEPLRHAVDRSRGY
jgi:glyoxylate/hydroxypyruvate reductase